MWRPFSFCLGVSLLLGACKSDSISVPTAPSTSPAPTIEVEVKATFDNTKPLGAAMNILDFTGTWCGWCPRAAVDAERIHAENPGRVTILAVHYGDQFDDKSVSNPFISRFNVTGFPTVIGNYKDKMTNNNNFYPQFSNYLAGFGNTAEVGVALDAKQDMSDSKLMHVVLSFGGNPNTTYSYIVARTESGFRANHSNYDNSLGGGTLANFPINHVVTALYTPSSGTSFNTDSKGVFRTANIPFRLASMQGITTELVVIILRNGSFVNSRAIKIVESPTLHVNFHYLSN